MSSVVIEKKYKSSSNLHQQGLLPIHSFQICIKYFQRKFSLDFFKKGRFSDVTYVRLFQNSYYDHMEDIRIYTLASFSFLRIQFDIFNVTFHFCYLKSKFWGGFPTKISFWISRTSHENSWLEVHHGVVVRGWYRPKWRLVGWYPILGA